MINEDLLKKLQALLDDKKGNKVRYRKDGENDFTDSTYLDYEVDNDSVIIKLKNEVVTTTNVKDISFTEYSERTDFWLYGDKTNRFNLDI